MERGAGASASRGGCWSGPKVAAWITKHPGRKTYAQRGGVYLRRLGWALQVPRRRHAQAATPARPHASQKSSGARYPLGVRRLPGHGERGGRLSRPGAGSSPSSGACGHAGASDQGRAARTAMSGARSTGSPTRAMAEPRGASSRTSIRGLCHWPSAKSCVPNGSAPASPWCLVWTAPPGLARPSCRGPLAGPSSPYRLVPPTCSLPSGSGPCSTKGWLLAPLPRSRGRIGLWPPAAAPSSSEPGAFGR
jgi:hypothetical protein